MCLGVNMQTTKSAEWELSLTFLHILA